MNSTTNRRDAPWILLLEFAWLREWLQWPFESAASVILAAPRTVVGDSTADRMDARVTMLLYYELQVVCIRSKQERVNEVGGLMPSLPRGNRLCCCDTILAFYSFHPL